MTDSKLRTVLGFDFGTRNIGVATGQVITRTASALPSLQARDGIPDWNQVQALIMEWKPDAVVVGIPLNMDGSESDMSRRARKFGNRIHGRFNLPFYQADERLTSFEAKEWANKLGHKGHYGSNPVDAMAAQIILEAWLNDPGNEHLMYD
ncbi:Holliday junction resolvase RuvX [Endozoicomonas sp. SCSIO W0465]|uniref:Holliday junction resolvase RuvX n=1 Tax=Endozoicomonas sp. SCSIO W0465 TaxID=2918516 RepID=UPI002074FE33|nr:Holliday junction resolvase RuvX [Endozoicomonas sp. SCSIO W0465]USE36510.1 Holliday junction resolvase RuvX [Endozoicomonas sp. SCSIO W0465]